jgi:hypothetical protein
VSSLLPRDHGRFCLVAHRRISAGSLCQASSIVGRSGQAYAWPVSRSLTRAA